jgi:hypothetical protein
MLFLSRSNPFVLELKDLVSRERKEAREGIGRLAHRQTKMQLPRKKKLTPESSDLSFPFPTRCVARLFNSDPFLVNPIIKLLYELAMT